LINRLAYTLLLSLAVAAALAACGGSSDSDRPAVTVRASTTIDPGPVAQARFIAQVDKICRRGWRIILDNFAEYSSWQSPKLSERELYAKAARLSFVAGLDFHIFDDIRGLKAPEGETAAVEEVLGAMQLGVERIQREPHLRISSPAELRAVFSDYNELARRYGLDQCLVAGSHLPPAASA
jgi:hypothetical protein